VVLLLIRVVLLFLIDASFKNVTLGY